MTCCPFLQTRLVPLLQAEKKADEFSSELEQTRKTLEEETRIRSKLEKQLQAEVQAGAAAREAADAAEQEAQRAHEEAQAALKEAAEARKGAEEAAERARAAEERSEKAEKASKEVREGTSLGVKTNLLSLVDLKILVLRLLAI
jgi:hypothetical protein